MLLIIMFIMIIRLITVYKTPPYRARLLHSCVLNPKCVAVRHPVPQTTFQSGCLLHVIDGTVHKGRETEQIMTLNFS